MGYTHYFKQLRDLTKPEWSVVVEDVKAILKDVQHVQGIPLADACGEGGTQPIITADCIRFNGLGEGGYETFEIYRIRPQLESWDSKDQRGCDWTKTDRRLYDLAVTAVLSYLSTGLHWALENASAPLFTASSDGSGSDWLAGVALAQRVIPRLSNHIDIPMGVMQEDRWAYIGFHPHLHVDGYTLAPCIDGHAYIIRHKDNAAYRFDTHDHYREFCAKHKDIVCSTGSFDAKRIAKLKRAQTRLFNQSIGCAESVGRNKQPPLYARPKAMPAVAKDQGDFSNVREFDFVS